MSFGVVVISRRLAKLMSINGEHSPTRVECDEPRGLVETPGGAVRKR